MSSTIERVEANSGLDVYEQTLAIAIAADLAKPLTSVADKTGKVWVGFINVISPDGRSVPVNTLVAQDNLDETVLLDTRAQNKTWRAFADFSYADYGFKKIGNMWIDPTNSAAVQFAEKSLAGRVLCVIL